MKILIIVLMALVGCDRHTGGNDVIPGMMGMQAECKEINQQFDQLLDVRGTRMNCGSAPNAWDGDYVNVTFGKIKSNLLLLQTKQPSGDSSIDNGAQLYRAYCNIWLNTLELTHLSHAQPDPSWGAWLKQHPGINRSCAKTTDAEAALYQHAAEAEAQLKELCRRPAPRCVVARPDGACLDAGRNAGGWTIRVGAEHAR